MTILKFCTQDLKRLAALKRLGAKRFSLHWWPQSGSADPCDPCSWTGRLALRSIAVDKPGNPMRYEEFFPLGEITAEVREGSSLEVEISNEMKELLN